MASNSSAPNALVSSYIHDALAMLESEDILDYFQDKGLDRSLRKKLRSLLLSINLVMDDAENKHLSNKHEHKPVSRWLHEVRDAVHDVDDILDEIQTEASQSKSKFLLVAEFQTTTSSSPFYEEVQKRLKKVRDNLESLASEKDDLGLEKIKSSGTMIVSQSLEPTSLVDKTEIICGRDDDKTKIIDLLNDDNSGNNLTVISIVAMGGMGKTTLARLVFNDKKMVEDEVFQFKAWVRVSQDFDVTKVTRKILEAFNLPTDGEDLDKLQNKLKENLAGKKYLLVLDNVWEENEESWRALLVPLLYGARGSKILVTTRSEKVASIRQCPKKVYQLKQLSEEQSWSLFAKHALCPANSTSDFEEIGKEIIKKCDGLPLALKAIGSLLYNKSSYDYWNTILTSHMWEWDISNNGCDIIPALILSYQSLPSSRKRCFAYCSLIPKGHEFDKDWLIELWMAENFLQVHQPSKGMKELGDQFFDDLLSRSFFQRSTSEKGLFVMHDLVNDLATYVSGEFCLRLKEEEQAKNLSKMTRHISSLIYWEEGLGNTLFEVTCKANKLRTFLFSNYLGNEVDDLLCKCKCLRALSFRSKYGNLPDSIGNFKHLRYLDLSHCHDLNKLPNSICLLYNLQTLKLTCCYSLEELPSNTHTLINLLHLYFEKTGVKNFPDGMGDLKKYEVLSSFYVGKCDEVNINKLGELLRLRGKLSIQELQNVTYPKDAAKADLKHKVHLKELNLIWNRSTEEVKEDGYEIDEEVLEKLQPPSNLKKLSIEGYDGAKFPAWLGDMSINNNIVSLKLIRCKYCVSLPPLWMLPSLKKLKIEGLEGIKSIGTEFYGNNDNKKEMDSHPHNSPSSSVAPFRSLQFLWFEDMKGWEEWECENNESASSSSSSSSSSSLAFPCLKVLVLSNCPQLKSKLPQYLPSLLGLDIRECPQVVGAYNKKKEFPGSSYTTSLQSLTIGGSEIKKCALFDSLRHLHFLKGSFEAFPLYLFPNLHQLRLDDCRNLERLDVGTGTDTGGGVTSHHHLTQLGIWKCPEFISIPQTFFFPSLTNLVLWECPKLASIPPPFTLFPSLTELWLKFCPEVEWPETEEEGCGGGGGGFPSTLKELEIYDCPKLFASRNKWDLRTLTSLTHLRIQDKHFNCVDCQGWLSLPPSLKLLNGVFLSSKQAHA